MITPRPSSIYSLALPNTKRVDRGLVLCRDRTSIVTRAAVCCAFLLFVYVYDVLCMPGDFVHLGDMIGRWLAWLAVMQWFDW